MSTPHSTTGMRRSRSTGSLWDGLHSNDDWSSELPCVSVLDDWSSELPFENDYSCTSLDDCSGSVSRRHSLLSNRSSSSSCGSSSSTINNIFNNSSSNPRKANRRRRRTAATTTTTTTTTSTGGTKLDRASRVRQQLAQAQDVKRTMSVYRRANRDILLMNDESARSDAETVDETLKVMEGLVKNWQVSNTSRPTTSRRRSSKALLA